MHSQDADVDETSRRTVGRKTIKVEAETPTKDPASGRALDFDLPADFSSKLKFSDERPATPTLHVDGKALNVSTTLMLQPAQNSTGDMVHILLAQQALSASPITVACCHDSDDTSAIAHATARVLTLLHPASKAHAVLADGGGSYQPPVRHVYGMASAAHANLLAVTGQPVAVVEQKSSTSFVFGALQGGQPPVRDALRRALLQALTAPAGDELWTSQQELLTNATKAADALAEQIAQIARKATCRVVLVNVRACSGRANNQQDTIAHFRPEKWMKSLETSEAGKKCLFWYLFSDSRKQRSTEWRPDKARTSYLYNGAIENILDGCDVKCKAPGLDLIADGHGLYRVRHLRLLARLQELLGPKVVLLGTTSGTTDMAAAVGIQSLNLHRTSSAAWFKSGETTLNAAEVRVTIQALPQHQAVAPPAPIQRTVFVAAAVTNNNDTALMTRKGDAAAGDLLKTHMADVFTAWLAGTLPSISVLRVTKKALTLKLPEAAKIPHLTSADVFTVAEGLQTTAKAAKKEQRKSVVFDWWNEVAARLDKVLRLAKVLHGIGTP